MSENCCKDVLTCKMLQKSHFSLLYKIKARKVSWATFRGKLKKAQGN